MVPAKVRERKGKRRRRWCLGVGQCDAPIGEGIGIDTIRSVVDEGTRSRRGRE